MLSFDLIDYAIIASYFIIAAVIGLRTSPQDSSAVKYIVAARKITLPAFVATLVATFYGGILGVGEFIYLYGISGWFLYAFPYYVFIIIFAFLFASKIRKSDLITIPDKLNAVYGKQVSRFSAILIVIITTPAPYILMLGVLISLATGFSLFLSILIGLIPSIIFLFKGGLLADVKVNIFEFVLMFLGFAVILPYCFINLGGVDYLTNNLDPQKLSLTGNNSLQYILVWFFIGAWAIVDPSFHQRCYAVNSPSNAKWGVLIALVFWIIFDIMTTIAGLYAAAHLTNIDTPLYSFPLLADSILPAAAKGFFFVGMAATIMSTLHSFAFISSTTIGYDLLQKRKIKTDEGGRNTKISLIIVCIVSLILALVMPSVVSIWYSIGSVTIPALLISVVSSYFKKLQISSNFMLISMIVSFVVSALCLLYGYLNTENGFPVYPLGLEPLYPGFICGILIYLYGFLSKPLGIEAV